MNLQQIPSKGEAKEIRRLFGAGPGNVLLSSDFSQQEPRCLAWLSGDTSMQNAYFTGKDLYSTMAAEAFHTTYENCLEFYLDENMDLHVLFQRYEITPYAVGLVDVILKK